MTGERRKASAGNLLFLYKEKEESRSNKKANATTGKCVGRRVDIESANIKTKKKENQHNNIGIRCVNERKE